MKRVIWNMTALGLLVCLLVIPPQTNAVVHPARTWLKPGESAVTDRAEFVLLAVKTEESASGLQYRLRADEKCRLELVGGNRCDILYLNPLEDGATEGYVFWSRDRAELQQVTVTLPTASSTEQFTYAIR